MAGTVKRMLDALVEQRGRSNPMLKSTTRTKLVLVGLNPAKFSDSSPDDPVLIERVRQVAAEYGVNV